jgi:hypothetical protein
MGPHLVDHRHQVECMRRPRPIGILLAGGVFGAFC